MPPSKIEQSFSSVSMITATSESGRRNAARCCRIVWFGRLTIASLPCLITSAAASGSIRKRYHASSDASKPQPISPVTLDLGAEVRDQRLRVALARRVVLVRGIPDQKAGVAVLRDAPAHARQKLASVIVFAGSNVLTPGCTCPRRGRPGSK